MKFKFPIPQFLSLPGDEEEEPPVNTARSPRHEKLRECVTSGVYKRAIVCLLSKVGTERYDPHNWGIVVDIDLARTWPLEVRWATGKTTFTDGDDLFPIYRSCAQADLEEMHARRMH